MHFMSSRSTAAPRGSVVDGRVGPVGLCCLALSLLAGCERTAPLEWTDGAGVEAMDDSKEAIVHGLMVKYSGKASAPQLLSEVVAEKRREAEAAEADEDAADSDGDSSAGESTDADAEEGSTDAVTVEAAAAPVTREQFVRLQELKHGQQVYMKRCVQCHGVSGGGDGPAADMLYPRPRDYTAGKFKFTSTPYDYRPLRSDLVWTLQRGVRGTSMPSFALLPKKDIEHVVDYILVLTQRGELASLLVEEADFLEDDLKSEGDIAHLDLAGTVADRWEEAKHSLTQPLTPEPELTYESAMRGKELFKEAECFKCHGLDGSGHTEFNTGLVDAWGYPTRAADLTSGMLRGGQEPIDIYRRIQNGINGTPMPGFENRFSDEPEKIWDLVSFVLYSANRRRANNELPAGLLKPFQYEKVEAAADGEGAE